MDYGKTKGRIFDIQRYSIHDGYGIRTIIFLKGCVLRCKWCCNPESQEYAIQKLVIDGAETTSGQDITVDEVMEIVEKDRNYYRRSGGGITLSGGESLCQPEFARDLLKAAKESGISTALESMAGVPYKNIEMILPYLDQYLLDIKHMDAMKHKEFTGQSNELMLENAKKIAEQCFSLEKLANRQIDFKYTEFKNTELSIRIPVVPTFNDKPEEIRAIAKFAKELKTVKRIHLLPYHRLGQDKYEGLGRKYEMPDIRPPSDSHMEKLLDVVKNESGLECQIGG